MPVNKYSLIVFDLDGTLAESKSPITVDMADRLVRLLAQTRVAVISGCRFGQFETQFLANLPSEADLSHLFLFPTCGAAFYRYDGRAWCEIYAEDLAPTDKQRILSALHKALNAEGHRPSQVWGALIEDRGTQITFSALGQEAPLAQKALWDPDQRKRAALRRCLLERIDDFDIKYGGTTSIDITRKGVDKAYGMRKIMSNLGHSQQEILFVGDRLEPGGNDHAVLGTGVRCVAVQNTAETLGLIDAILRGDLEPDTTPSRCA
jgi:phosphomannomutase